MRGSAVTSSNPRVMKCSEWHRSRKRSISASISTQSRPAATLMRLTRPSGRKREDLASKPDPHPVTAVSKARAATGSEQTYCTSHLVPSAAHRKKRNGSGRPGMGAAGDGLVISAVSDMVRSLQSTGEFYPDGEHIGLAVQKLRRHMVEPAHRVAIIRG